MSMVTPGLLGNLSQFRQRFATPIERNHDTVAATALRQLTSPFLLRRTKAEVARELPPRIETLVPVVLAVAFGFDRLGLEEIVSFTAVVNERRVRLRIVGIGAAPDYLYEKLAAMH